MEPIPPATTTPSRSDGARPEGSASSEPAERQDGFFPEEGEPTGFLAMSFAELRKVVWPSRQQLFSESVAVILMVSLSAAAIAAIDRFYGWGSSQIFR